jgi:hypothetical protein
LKSAIALPIERDRMTQCVTVCATTFLSESRSTSADNVAENDGA